MKPFRTDGCSMWPDGNYRNCCVEHDKIYWRGGTYRDRLAADTALLKCVASRPGISRPWVAILMFIGVRIGGAFVWPVPWRWGYGHKWPSTGKAASEKQDTEKTK